MAAKKKEIKEVTAEQRSGPAGPPPWSSTRGSRRPATRKAGQKVASVEELVQKLKNEAKVL